MDMLPSDEYLAMMRNRNYESIIALRWDNKDALFNTPNSAEFRHLCDALLREGRFDDAIEHYQRLIDARRLDMRGGHDYGELAAAYWLQGDRENAIANLRQALECNYGDGAKNMTPALLLYYAAVRTADNDLKEEACKQIREKLDTGWARNWPAPLGRFLVGVADETHVEQELAREHPLRQPDERCRFDFYRGVQFLEAGDEATAKACFRAAVDVRDQKTWSTEFVLARHELGETPTGDITDD
jgi:tetratricopeptide (TPR) repeat protein